MSSQRKGPSGAIQSRSSRWTYPTGAPPVINPVPPQAFTFIDDEEHFPYLREGDPVLVTTNIPAPTNGELTIRAFSIGTAKMRIVIGNFGAAPMDLPDPLDLSFVVWSKP